MPRHRPPPRCRPPHHRIRRHPRSRRRPHLLSLADEEEGAQFWWHYATGAGNTTAVLCLYLLHLHLHHGDMHDARHWAGPIHRLNRLGWSSYTPVPHHADIAAGPSSSPEVHYTLPVPGPTVCESAVKDAIDELRGRYVT